MPLSHINPTQTNSWKQLQKHFAENEFELRELFVENPKRFEDFSIKNEGFLFDFSKNLITKETLTLLLNLAEECDLALSIEKLFSGDKINETENRPALHTALRDFSDNHIVVDGENIKLKIKKVLDQMKDFSQKVLSGQHKGFTDKEITDIVNIGIGGSDLGPAMVCDALKHYSTGLETHFVSNIDGAHLSETLKNLNPETTIFIIASKTFSTEETMTNAFSAKKWFLQSGNKQDLSKHFVAVSANVEKVVDFGISEENCFQFWDWVGGRYSLWSSVGLSIVLSIGYENFEELLTGAQDIDQHFRDTDFDKNIPVLMGVLGIWYRNFFDAHTVAILPYSQYLDRFPAYLQQTDMESNGKSVDRDEDFVDYQTAPIIWGEAGTNGQHAFYQLIHQGTELIPSCFIAYVESCNKLGDHHEKLLSNCFAQTKALAFGINKDEIEASNNENSKTGINYKLIAGNHPSDTLLFDQLTPFSLGQLIALYEHKIFVQGVIWNIFSFDQWGVELGKNLAHEILPELISSKKIDRFDGSTNGLINYSKKSK